MYNSLLNGSNKKAEEPASRLVETQASAATSSADGEALDELIECEVDTEHRAMLCAVVKHHRILNGNNSEKWHLTNLRKVKAVEGQEGAFLASCVLCCGDKCQMETYTAVFDASKEAYDVFKGTGAPAPQEGSAPDAAVVNGGSETPEDVVPEAHNTPAKKVEALGGSIPLWPDPKTPVAFGSLRTRPTDSTAQESPAQRWRGTVNSDSRKRDPATPTKSSTPATSNSPTSNIPTGVHPLRTMDEYHQLLETAANGKVPVVIDFYADWCGPCNRMKPIFAQMASSFAGRAYFCNVNTDEAKDIARVSSIRSLPTFHIIKGGRVVESILGANVDALRNAILKHVARANGGAGSGGRQTGKAGKSTSNRRGLSTLGIDESVLPCIGTTPSLFISTKNLKQIEAKILEMNNLLLKSDGGLAHALLPLETESVHDLVGILKASNRWHSNSVTRKHVTVLERLLQWPSHMCYPALDLVRIVFLHPTAERLLLGSPSFGRGGKLLQLVFEHATAKAAAPETGSSASAALDKVADRNCTLSLRCAVNLFKYRNAWALCAQNNLFLLNLCTSNFPSCRVDRKLREAVGKLMLNVAMVEYAFPTEASKEASAEKDGRAAVLSKLILFSTLLIGLEVNDQGKDGSGVNVSTLRNALQALGTSVYTSRKIPDVLSAGTRQSIAVAMSNLSGFKLLQEVQALHKALAMVPKTSRVVEEFPNPWGE